MEERHNCPICNKYVFEEHNSLEICDVCLWQDDAIQENDPDYRGGANKMSLNEAKEAYKNGIQIR
ncbi:MAG: hypothetical protein IJZ65_00545 [Ruminiclostridium sp.]|nr:hypothetical protein [Ruminiclostridium sp.]